MKIFVTGGTGFIGSHFLSAAFRAKLEVIALRRSPFAKPKFALTTDPIWLDKPMEQVEAADFRGCDALVHFAATGVSPQKSSWEELVKWNVIEASHLCFRALEAGVRRLVVAGTYAEYGKAGERYTFIPHYAPLEPTSSYAASKAALFLLLHGLSYTKPAELFYGRIFSAFGEGQHEDNFWPSLRRAALAGENFPMTLGEQVRDFIPVEQVADAFICALTRSDLHPGEPKVENLGTGQPQTVRAFAEHWWRLWEAKGRLLPGALSYRENEVMRYVPELTR